MTLQQSSLLEKVFYTGQKNLAMEWFGNVRISTILITLGTMLIQIFSSEHNDRNMRSDGLGFQLPCKFQTIHHRHHDITDYQIRNFLPGDFQPFLTIGSLKDIKLILQKRANILTNVIIIINHQ